MPYDERPGDVLAPLPGEYEPCGTCGSTERLAYGSEMRVHIGMLCSNHHVTKFADPDTDSIGSWIPRKHFRAGGKFFSLLPATIVGLPKSDDASRRCDINLRRVEWILSEQRACLRCGTPPMHDAHDGRKLFEWLRDHHHRDHADVLVHINAAPKRPTFGTWRACVAEIDPELDRRIARRINDSMLQAEHTVPRKVLETLWDSWDTKMRKFGKDSLAFGFCRPHNIGKHDRIPSGDELRRWHIAMNHGGVEANARRDTASWAILHRIIASLEEHTAQQAPKRDDAASDAV